MYKANIIEQFRPKTVNLRIQALNKFLEHTGKSKLRLKSVKVQQHTFLENVISQADYTFLKKKLQQEENLMWYFVVRFLTAQVHVSVNLFKSKLNMLIFGYFDI